MSGPRALLIEPPYGEPKMEPAGLLYLATVARAEGFAVDLLYESPKTRFTVEAAAARAVAGGYDVVGLTAMTPTLPRALAILRAVKRARPATIGVIGGYHATVASAKVIERHPEVDVAVRGEGEATLVEMLQRRRAGRDLAGVSGLSYRHDGRVVENELRPLSRHLDTLPFPDRSLGPGPEEFVHFYDEETGRHEVRANVCSSRGCPYGCGFCVLGSDDPGSPISMRKWRARSPENVVEEIARLVAERGVGNIMFAEDNFTVSPRRLAEFADLVIARDLRFTFTCDSRANQICRLESVMPKLRRAGLRKVEVGIESGSQAVLDRFAKGTTVRHNVEALRILRENRILPRIDFIMFEPFTTVADLEENVRFLKHNAPPHYEHNRTVYQKLELHPGTALQRQYLADGFVSGDPDEVVPYEFVDPDVRRIFAVMDRFYWDQQIRLDELKKRIHFLQVNLLARGDRAAVRRLARELVYLVVPLNALPLRLFEAVLQSGRRGGYAEASLAAPARSFAERTSRLERELDDLLAAQGLADTARLAYSYSG
jgi:anaerobic magnesium-protoporphyrin IX monomethyl ester cyclase